ncbi:cyclic lactone autoinducer peptide [Paenibacillus kribbensis]|nr:cyclic lactone autoinducer peptide [Paenibacillus kribbensis]MEC0234100.1 cyclic lactone autoinducer peptide [Paenibacillus kribbensis]
MKKSIYSNLATLLSTIAVLTVSVASIAFIYSPEPPAELFE